MKGKEKQNSLITFEGAFSINTLSFFGNYIKNILVLNSITKNKLYKIFFELSQNIAYYSLERQVIDSSGSVGIGSFALREFETYILIETFNSVTKKEGKVIVDYCREINKFTSRQLRDLKACKRRHNESKEAGAHIGLVQVCIYSLNQLEYSLKSINSNKATLKLACKINKNYKIK